MAIALAGLFVCAAARAVEPEEVPLNVAGKARYHWRKIGDPLFVPRIAAHAAVRQWRDDPIEWGQGAGAYGARMASAAGIVACRNVFAFALDSTLREDPRYRRAGEGGVFARITHAFRETVLTRTDSGRVRFSTWRLGSAVGAQFLSRVWYPDRLNTVSSALQGTAISIGGDLLSNVGKEFWPDVKRGLRHR